MKIKRYRRTLHLLNIGKLFSKCVSKGIRPRGIDAIGYGRNAINAWVTNKK